MPYLMSVPVGLTAAVQSQAAYVSGAMVKDAVTNQVLAHLQPSGLLTQALSLGSAGPLVGVQALSGLGQNLQLLQIKQMLDTLQTVASIGAAASVLSLGVSVGGFALVLKALKRVQATLDGVQGTVDRVESKLDARFFSSLDTELRRAEETFEIASERRLRRWEDTEHCIDQQIGEVVLRLRDLGVVLEVERLDATAWQLLAEPTVIGLLSLLAELANARAEALLCLGRPQHAVRLFQRAEGWMAALPTDAKALAQERTRGQPLSTELIGTIARQSKAMATWATCGRAVAQERALLCQSLQDLRIDTQAYVLEVRDHPEPTLLMLPHDPAGLSRLQALTA